jgi:hypothetical protein
VTRRAAAQPLDMVSAADGQVWIEIPVAPANERSWIVLSEAGDWVANARTPLGLRILYLTRRFALVVREDLNGRPRIDRCAIVAA